MDNLFDIYADELDDLDLSPEEIANYLTRKSQRFTRSRRTSIIQDDAIQRAEIQAYLDEIESMCDD